MVNPLPVRGITGHLVWGADGAVWACFEVEPFAYPHRSVRDAREVHVRTTAALLGLSVLTWAIRGAIAVLLGFALLKLSTRKTGEDLIGG